MAESVSVEEMRQRDAATIAAGTPGSELMRRAAQGIYDAYENWPDGTVIYAGSGNNGGDGYALAQILADMGRKVTVLRLAPVKTSDAALYEKKALASGAEILDYAPGLMQEKRPAVIVDCLLGTGFHGEVREPYASAIREINRCREDYGAFVISADINSGMNGDTGEGELIVISDLTVTIGLMKNGLLKESAMGFIGKLALAEIGIV